MFATAFKLIWNKKQQAKNSCLKFLFLGSLKINKIRVLFKEI